VHEVIPPLIRRLGREDGVPDSILVYESFDGWEGVPMETLEGEEKKAYFDALEKRILEENLRQQAQVPLDPRLQEFSDKLEAADAARQAVEARKAVLEEARQGYEDRVDVQIEQARHGGLRMGINKGRVMLDFGAEVKGISLDPRDAMKVGREMIKLARKALKG
jgi:hypothetical protein